MYIYKLFHQVNMTLSDLYFSVRLHAGFWNVPQALCFVNSETSLLVYEICRLSPCSKDMRHFF